jgi:oligopeptide transport system substrate-binding protein
MYRTLFGIVLVFAVAGLLVGLTFSTVREKRADYVFVNGTEPKTLDPQKMTGQPEQRLADALFEGLTYHDNDTLKPVPGSAESWDTSPDGLRWTFHMRKAARWSNGDRVTAHDFVYAWKRLQEPAIGSEYAQLMHMVRHAEAYNTYGGQLRLLRGDPDAEDADAKEGILRGLDALVAAHPEGLPAKDWQEFVGKRTVSDAVANVQDPTILEALGRQAGTFTPEEGRALAEAFRAEATRRGKALAEAQKHFGVDEGMFAPDDDTFVVELRSSTPYFLELTSFFVNHPVHRPTVEKWPDDWFREGRIVSNGPFLMESWRVNDKIRLRKNPDYWGASDVSLETVDALPIDNETTALNLYMTGQADWLPSTYPPDLIDVLSKRPDFYANPGMIVYFYRINCSKKPFNDARVRKALGMSFDRKAIVEQITRKGEIPTNTLVAPGIPGYESPKGLLTYDPAEARRLLAEAGYPGGKGFPPFAIVYNTNEGHKKIAEYISDQWRKNLNIEATATNQEWQSILENVRRLNYDVERAGWIGDYRDPNTFLDLLVSSNGNNQTGWGDPYYDQLIRLAADPLKILAMSPADREAFVGRFKERSRGEPLIEAMAKAEPGEARRVAASAVRLHLFREAEAIAIQDAIPFIPIYFYVVTGLVSPRVEGFHAFVEDDGRKIPNLQDLHPFRDVRMRPEGTPHVP